MPAANRRSLWELIAAAGLPASRVLSDPHRRFALRDLRNGSTLDIAAGGLRGRVVLLHARQQMAAALAMAELDGVAARLILAPPDLPRSQLADAVAKAGVEVVLSDDAEAPPPVLGDARAGRCGQPIHNAQDSQPRDRDTEWLLFTSGTTGRPKLVVHDLQSLIGPSQSTLGATPAAVWSTFYDIRRYGGLQIMLRAFLGGGSMVFSDPAEGPAAFLARAGGQSVTHISGTPSHWRRALMTPTICDIAPDYVRLSGELADQAILNQLGHVFPKARITHAFASTEAGVAFDVQDGLAGFPASLLDEAGAGDVALRVRDGSLRIRSSRTASRYLGAGQPVLRDENGYVDTGDMLTLRDDRYHFVGRKGGIINVGGNKVYPEEVEEVINRHPDVRMSLVRGRSNPITGALVVADVVARSSQQGTDASADPLRREILQACRLALPPHKVPAVLRLVSSLDVAPSGKLSRLRA